MRASVAAAIRRTGWWMAAYIMPAMLGAGAPLRWELDPLEALRRWPADRRVAMLHSGRFHPRWARRSILAEPVGVFRFDGEAEGTSRTGRSAWRGAAGVVAPEAFTGKPFHDLRELLRVSGAGGGAASGGGDGLWIGHLAYDLGRWVEALPSRAAADRSWPIIELGWCPGYLVHDGATGRWQACGDWARAGAPELPSLPPLDAGFAAGALRSVLERAAHERAVRRVLEYIGAGDIFQANLAQRFTADFAGDWPLAPRALYRRLATLSPAWYGAYLELGDDDLRSPPTRAIASTSPELFLEVDERGHVVTRPIKGTRPADASPDELLRSAKDRAELNMIVDLLRNDLGRVCVYGSVQVPEPRTIESHPTVHHGVATVTGRLHPSKDLVDLLRATMPGGSVTGAPKVRAMQIIEELEPVRRGPYCGAIGWLSPRGACLNIAIRTLLLERLSGGAGAGRVDFSVGGGIVADSTPAQEIEETLDKAAALLGALGLPRPGRGAEQPERAAGGAGHR